MTSSEYIERDRLEFKLREIGLNSKERGDLEALQTKAKSAHACRLFDRSTSFSHEKLLREQAGEVPKEEPWRPVPVVGEGWSESAQGFVSNHNEQQRGKSGRASYLRSYNSAHGIKI